MKNLENLINFFDYFNDAIYVVDNERKILYFNPKASEITGYKKEEVENHFCMDNILNHVDKTGKNLCVSGCPLLWAMRNNKQIEELVYLKHKDGHRVPVNVKVMPYVVDDVVVGAIEVFSDETEKSIAQDIFPDHKNLDIIDPLTSLYNRRLLENKLPLYLSEQKNKSLGVLFIDFDHFKEVNDQFGHKVGDEFLVLLSKTISKNIRRKDLAMRYGGDEVVVFLLDITEEELRKIADKIRILINKSKPSRYEGIIKVTASIGGVIRGQNEPIEFAIDRADQAMLVVKRNGKNNILIR